MVEEGDWEGSWAKELTPEQQVVVVPSVPRVDVYIAGPMRGVENYNYGRFNLLAADLRASGLTVFNPAEAYGGDQSRPLQDYYAEDFAALTRASSVVFLPGWQNSNGARIEYLIARDLGLKLKKAVFDKFIAGPEYVKNVVPLEADDVPVELEAGLIVRNGARQAVYGHPSDDFNRTAAMWDVLGFSSHEEPHKVALGMIALKMSRLMGTPDHRDSIVDIIGYAICADRLWREHG